MWKCSNSMFFTCKMTCEIFVRVVMEGRERKKGDSFCVWPVEHFHVWNILFAYAIGIVPHMKYLIHIWMLILIYTLIMKLNIQMWKSISHNYEISASDMELQNIHIWTTRFICEMTGKIFVRGAINWHIYKVQFTKRKSGLNWLSFIVHTFSSQD